jgi:hypothetical protein
MVTHTGRHYATINKNEAHLEVVYEIALSEKKRKIPFSPQK